MAEIKVEQKKQNWPWIIVGFVVAGILIYFIAFRDNDNRNTMEETTETSDVSQENESGLMGENENNGNVAAYVNFVESDTNRDSLDHAYIKEAFAQLTAATNALADEIGYDIQGDLDKVEESVNLIDNEPFETSHAQNVRNAADNSTTALQNMQRAEYPELSAEADELRSASESINPEVLTLEQKNAVKNYFTKASDLLEKMN